MIEKKQRAGQGTFAQLYDAQEELSQRNTKPLGRPPKKIQRKPTTIHLTPTENRHLGRLHLMVNEQISINRSELVGVAVDVLTILMEKMGTAWLKEAQIHDVEEFRQAVSDFAKS